MHCLHPDSNVALTEREKDARTYVRLARSIDTPEEEIQTELEQRGYSREDVLYLLITSETKLERQRARQEVREHTARLLKQTVLLSEQIQQTARRTMQLRETLKETKQYIKYG